MNPFGAIGQLSVTALGGLGQMSLFAMRGAVTAVTPPFFLRAFASAFYRIGFASLPVVGLTALFTGGALALNIYDGSARFNAESFLPQIVGMSLVRELGPVLAALMVAGRATSAMAAEIGAMRVSEQIDALSTLNVSPFRYLIAPRILAGTIAMPILVLVADIIGVYGGWLVAVYLLDFSGPIFVTNLLDFVTSADVGTGLIKATVFGFLLSVMGCFFGFHSRGGASGVGAATRAAVVVAAVAIFASNYLLTSLFVDI